MVKRVVWTESARRSRRLILEYWAKETGNKKYSRKIAGELNKRIDTLAEFPEAGRLTTVENIRTLAAGHFSIFYFITKDEIVIAGIYDTRREPGEIIRELKQK